MITRKTRRIFELDPESPTPILLPAHSLEPHGQQFLALRIEEILFEQEGDGVSVCDYDVSATGPYVTKTGKLHARNTGIAVWHGDEVPADIARHCLGAEALKEWSVQ